MGCVESSEALSIDDDEQEEAATPVARKTATAAGKAPAEKGEGVSTCLSEEGGFPKETGGPPPPPCTWGASRGARGGVPREGSASARTALHAESYPLREEGEAELLPVQNIPYPQHGKKRKKSSLKSKSGKKLVETQSLKERSENTKIRVIWRRCSVFSNRRDSIKSDKSQEGESAAGPSRKPPEEPQA